MIKWLFMTTLAGSVASLFFILLRAKLASKFGGRWYYYACLIALLLFVLPLHFKVPLAQLQVPYLENQIHSEPNHPVQETTADVGASVPERVSGVVASDTHDVFSILSLDQWMLGIWFVGCIGMMCRYMFAYFRFKKRAIQASPIDYVGHLPVVVSGYARSPMLIGFYKPTVVIPNVRINPEDYRLALQHEWIHYKQRDGWIKLMAVLINCIHWFNPVSYFALANISEACEYSVDERITKNLKPAEKKRYSEMILNFASSLSPVLNSHLAQSKNQLRRRFALIMKRKTGSGKISFGILIAVMIAAVSIFSSSVVFAEKPRAIKEYGGAITTYYNTSKSLEENVRLTLGISSGKSRIGTMKATETLYIDADGLKIDFYNRAEPYYRIVRHWQDKESAAVADMTRKTLSIEGQKVTVAFNDRAKNYIDDKAIQKMIVNQIAFEFTYRNKKTKYDHQMFIHELIKRGVYVIEEVETPKEFKYNLSRTTNGAVVGHKPLTSYDKKNTVTSIFNGKAKLPKSLDNGEANQGVQLGSSFTIKSGETLAIDIKELTDKMPTINLSILDETTGEAAASILNASSRNRYIFTPGKNEAHHSFKIVASGEATDKAAIEIFTFKTGKEEIDV